MDRRDESSETGRSGLGEQGGDAAEGDHGLELAALRCLAAATAHDLKNILGLLRLQLDSMEEESGGVGAGELAQVHEGIAEGMIATDRFAELVRGLTTEAAPVLLRHLLTDQQKRIEREHAGRVLVITDYTDRSLLARCRPGRVLGALRRMVDEAIAGVGEGILVLRAEESDEGTGIVVGAVSMPGDPMEMLDELDRWLDRFRSGGEIEPAPDDQEHGRLVYLEKLRFPA